MKTRLALLSVAGAAALPGVGASKPAEPAKPAEPKPVNIVVINLDDLGYGDFSSTGALGLKRRTSTA